jgi:hypothetical protein
MLSHIISHKTFDWIASLLTNKKERNFILDPLTCVIRVAVLSFKPKGTKISISDNRIEYHDPNFLQGPLRWTQGDNREDLHNLYYPILKATQWYSKDDPKYKVLFDFAIKGLKNLINSYSKNSLISHSLAHYIKILENSKNNTDLEHNHMENSNTQQVNHIYTELKKLWNEREIDIIKNLLLQLEQNIDSEDYQEINIGYMNSISEILFMKEKRVNELLLKSYSVLE